MSVHIHTFFLLWYSMGCRNVGGRQDILFEFIRFLCVCSTLNDEKWLFLTMHCCDWECYFWPVCELTHICLIKNWFATVIWLARANESEREFAFSLPRQLCAENWTLNDSMLQLSLATAINRSPFKLKRAQHFIPKLYRQSQSQDKHLFHSNIPLPRAPSSTISNPWKILANGV